MSDKEYNEQKQRIRKLIDLYHAALGFNWFDIDHTYSRVVDEQNEGTGAKAFVSWEYLQANVTWYLPVIAEQDDAKLKSIFLHEYSHILTGGLMAQVPNDNEQASQIMEYTAEIVGRTLSYAIDFKEPRNERKSTDRKKVTKKVSKSQA